jgi:hypothetical protein
MAEALTKKAQASHHDLSPMCAEFRKRAARLKLGAYFFFALIFPLFGAGVYVLYNASQITSFDIAGGGLDSKLSEASAEFDKLQARSQEIGQLIQWYIEKVRTALSPFLEDLDKKYSNRVPNARPNNVIIHKPATVNEIADTILDVMSKATPESDGRIQLSFDLYGFGGVHAMTREQWSNDAAQALRNIDFPFNVAEWKKLYEESESNQSRRVELTNLMTTIRQTKANLDVAKLTGSELTAGVNETARLVQTSITRFGTLAIISFLVGIFISLYRYNVRLAGYYQARADALALMSTSLNTVGFPTLSTTLTPQLDFGKVPRTPTGEVIDLLHALRPDTPKAKEG